MYQMKRFIDMKHSLCLPVCFCFYQLGLCSVSYTANEYSIYHFCIIIKDFFISFSRVIIVYHFETVKLQLHYAIYRLRFYSNSLIHILSLSNSHNNVPSTQKNRADKSHRVTVALSLISIVRPSQKK